MSDRKKASARPKVSVCLATYQRAEMLREAIESVLQQHEPSLELIISDDASDDRTPEVAASISDPRLKYHRNRRRLGQWGNRTKCLELARGEYLIFLSDDDRMLPGLLGQEAAILDRHLNVGFVAPGFEYIDEHGHPFLTRQPLLGPGSFTVIPQAEISRYFLLGERVSGGHSITWIWPSVMMRKKTLLAVGGFEEDLHHADELTMYKMSMVSDFGQVHNVLFQYRYHPGSIAIESAASGNVFDEYRAVLERALVFARERGVDLPPDQEKQAWQHLARKTVSLNGAISWTGARFEGSYLNRAAKVWEIFLRCVRMNPAVLAHPISYATLAGSILLPRWLILALARWYMRVFQR